MLFPRTYSHPKHKTGNANRLMQFFLFTLCQFVSLSCVSAFLSAKCIEKDTSKINTTQYLPGDLKIEILKSNSVWKLIIQYAFLSVRDTII